MACWGRHKQREKGESWRKEGGTVRRDGELREEGASWEGSENLFYPHFHSSGRIRTYCFFFFIYIHFLFWTFHPCFLAVCGSLLLLEGCWHIAPFWNVLSMGRYCFCSFPRGHVLVSFFISPVPISLTYMEWDETQRLSFLCFISLVYAFCYTYSVFSTISSV